MKKSGVSRPYYFSHGDKYDEGNENYTEEIITMKKELFSSPSSPTFFYLFGRHGSLKVRSTLKQFLINKNGKTLSQENLTSFVIFHFNDHILATNYMALLDVKESCLTSRTPV